MNGLRPRLSATHRAQSNKRVRMETDGSAEAIPLQ